MKIKTIEQYYVLSYHSYRHIDTFFWHIELLHDFSPQNIFLFFLQIIDLSVEVIYNYSTTTDKILKYVMDFVEMNFLVFNFLIF